jgi:hypothetical protein
MVPRPSATLVVADHVARSVQHHRIADILFDADEEWAAVPYFYASLHRIRAALLADPIFDNPAALRTKHHLLTHRDRHCNKHNGHFRNGTKVWGLNELVNVLYPQVIVSYEALFRGIPRRPVRPWAHQIVAVRPAF